MKYFLKNIAQQRLPRTILFIVLGGAMWLPSLIGTVVIAPVVVTLVLTLVNSLLTMHFFYKAGSTNLPSPFVMSTYWLAMSAIPVLHNCWQGQLVILGMLLILIVLLKVDYQHEAVEESFLATLICMILAVLPSILMIGVFMIWGYLLIKGHMTWRVWLASLIAIAIRVVLMAVLHYMGWLELLWMENIPHLSWQLWLIFVIISALTIEACYLPIKKTTVVAGASYVVYLLLLITIGVLSKLPLPLFNFLSL